MDRKQLEAQTEAGFLAASVWHSAGFLEKGVSLEQVFPLHEDGVSVSPLSLPLTDQSIYTTERLCLPGSKGPEVTGDQE